MTNRAEISGADVVLSVYSTYVDQATPETSWDIELALLDRWKRTFDLALEFAGNDEQREQAQTALDALQALRDATLTMQRAEREDDGEILLIVDERDLPPTA
jgi:hypothetical protein